jgi:hypothetical protein
MVKEWGISIDFMIFSNFPFLEGGGSTPGDISNVLHILPNTRNKNLYGLGVGSQ